MGKNRHKQDVWCWNWYTTDNESTVINFFYWSWTQTDHFTVYLVEIHVIFCTVFGGSRTGRRSVAAPASSPDTNSVSSDDDEITFKKQPAPVIMPQVTYLLVCVGRKWEICMTGKLIIIL